MSASYVDANNYAMFSPVFRNSRGVSGRSTATTSARSPRPPTTPSPRSPWPPATPSPHWAHERAQTPRHELPLKCQTLYMDVDNCLTVGRRAGSVAAETGCHGRPGYGSEWLTPNQLASRQHARQMRELSARSTPQYSYLLRTPPPSPCSPRLEKKRHQPKISLKHLLTAVMSRTQGANAGIRRNYVCFKLHDDRKTPKMAPSSPVGDNLVIGDALTMSDHFGVAVSRTSGADMSVEVECFSSGAGAPPSRESLDLTRSQRSVRFNVSTEIREYQPALPLAV